MDDFHQCLIDEEKQAGGGGVDPNKFSDNVEGRDLDTLDYQKAKIADDFEKKDAFDTQ